MNTDIRKESIWWHTDDYFSPNLSKSSLGLFVYTVLAEGAIIGTIWPLNHKFHRSWVGCTIKATEEQKNN